MKYNSRVNVLYDTIYYHITYFNEKTMISIMKELFCNDDVSLYGTLRDNRQIDDPDPALYPFFYWPKDRPSALSQYMSLHFDYFNGTFESFIRSIQTGDTFRRFMFDYFCRVDPSLDSESALNGNAETISKIVAANSFHGDQLPYVANLFFHFSELVDLLVLRLRKIRPIVEALHRKYRRQVEPILESILTEDDIAILKKWVRIPNTVNLHEQTFSLCFINPYIIYETSIRCGYEKQYLFIMGYYIKSSKEHFLLWRHKTSTPLNVLITLGHELRYEIIEQLRKRPMTVSQLSQELHIARTSIIRCITILLDETVLLPSTQKGVEKYYELNHEYFSKSNSMLSQYFNRVLTDLKSP